MAVMAGLCDLQPLDGREFVVAVGEVVLGEGAGQVFHENDGVVAVLGVFGHGRPGDVDVRAAGALVGEHHAHLLHGRALVRFVRLDQARHVVGVGQRHAAFARGHGLDLVGVAALGRARHVVHHALEPGLALGVAQALDHGGEQRQVVGVRARAGADQALELGVGQLLVGGHVGGLHAQRVVHDHAGAGRETGPGHAVGCGGGAQVGGNGRVQLGGLDRLEQPLAVGRGHARGVDQHDHVGRRGGTLGAQARHDAGVVRVHAVDLDAGGLGEGVVHHLVGLVVAGRVEVEHLVLGLGVQGGGAGGQDNGREASFCMGAFCETDWTM